MSEPPPKPARRPIRATRDSKQEDSEDFEFGVASKSPQPQSEAPQEQQHYETQTDSPEQRSQVASPQPDSSSSNEGSQPPRPPHRPQRPASRPIHIQPAPADPPHVREKSGLRTELEGLDKPEAAYDEASVQRFKEIQAKLGEEGPGGETAQSLGFPELLPRKVLQSAPAPPQKPLTRPMRKYKSPPNDNPVHKHEPTSTEHEQQEHEQPASTRPNSEESFVSEEPKHTEAKTIEPASIESSTKDSSTKAAESKTSSASKEFTATGITSEKVGSEEPASKVSTSAEPEVKRPEFQEATQANESSPVIDDLENKIKSVPETKGPSSSKDSAIKEAPDAPFQDPTLKDAKEAPGTTDEKPKTLDHESHRLEGDEPLLTSQKLDPKKDAEAHSQKLNNNQAIETPVECSEEIPDRSHSKKTFVDSKVFAEPEAVNPDGSEVARFQNVDVDPNLSKEDNDDIDPSTLDPRESLANHSDKSSFTEPATSAPDSVPAPSSPKKRVAFIDTVTKISTEGDDRDRVEHDQQATVSSSNKQNPETDQGNPKESLKPTESSKHRIMPHSTIEDDNQPGKSRAESTGDKDVPISVQSDKTSSLRGVSEGSFESKNLQKPAQDKDQGTQQKHMHDTSSTNTGQPVQEAIDSDHISESVKEKPGSALQERENVSESGKLGMRVPNLGSDSKVSEENESQERRISDPVDPKDGSAKPPRPQHRPEIKPRPVPKPKPKNALTSRFEAALRENEASKQKPIPRPKPKEGPSGNRISAIQASMFADLNQALSRGPPPGGRPQFGSNDSQESHGERVSGDAASTDQKVDANESADVQLQAMPKKPMARAAGPRRTKRLPESAKPSFSIVTAEQPIWEIPGSDKEESTPRVSNPDISDKSKASDNHTPNTNEVAELQAPKYSDRESSIEKTETRDESNALNSTESRKGQVPKETVEQAVPESKKYEPAPSMNISKKNDIDEEQDRCAEEGLYAEPTVETRWVPDRISQAEPSQRSRGPEDLPDDEHRDLADSDGGGSGGGGPNLRADTENDLRNALQRHLSNESPEVGAESQNTHRDSKHSVTVEDLPPLGSLVDRVISPPNANAASSQSSMGTLMTPQRPRQEQTSVSSLGVDSLSQYLDKSPQTGDAPSGWDRMPAASKLDLGEAEGLLKDVKKMKEKSEYESRKKKSNAEPSE